jgi:anaerobic dimethyl sulfoxide reductase subunit B (iron-sulfur subunit)
MKACPNEAIYKEEKYGAVLIEPDKCRGTRKCWKACPYGAPQYDGDEPGATMSKCNMCIDRLEQEAKPICVLSCSMRSMEFAPLSELKKRYGKLKRLEEMPKDSITNPAVIFKPADTKRSVIPWDPKRALELWQKRQPDNGKLLPEIFDEITDVTQISTNIIGRNQLVLKAKNAKELIYYTTDNE